jgi:F-type H+-transporting ATPase subunit epsilon
MSHEIDLEKARHDLERAKAAGENDDAAAEAYRRAAARIRAVEKAT